MVLVEVVQLVIQIDGCFNSLGNIEFFSAETIDWLALVVLLGDFLNLVTHDEEYDSESQEHYTEY